MLKSWKEYGNEVVVPSLKWTQRHWKGYLVFIAAFYGATYAYIAGYGIGDIKEFIKEKFSKEEES